MMEQKERFEQIYRDTRDEILRFLVIRTNADAEAEDLFQEVYRRLYVRMQKSVLPIIDPKRYVYAVARKVLSRFYRKRSLVREHEQPITEDTETNIETVPIDEALFAEERKDAVWKLLSDEPELNRRAFILYYGYERTQKQIAEALGITEDAVRQRLYRTRCRIRSLLESDR